MGIEAALKFLYGTDTHVKNAPRKPRPMPKTSSDAPPEFTYAQAKIAKLSAQADEITDGASCSSSIPETLERLVKDL